MYKYNNGTCIPFETIKANRDVAVKEIAEGNLGLENLLNACIDNGLETRACCGDDGYLMFELNDRTIGKLDHIFNYFEKRGMESSLSVSSNISRGASVTLYFDPDKSLEQCSMIADIIRKNQEDGFNLTLECLSAIMDKFNEYGVELFFSSDGLTYFVDVANFNQRIVEENPEVSQYMAKLDDLQIGDGRNHELYSFGDKESLVELTYALYFDEKEENNKKGILGRLKNIINSRRSK